LGFGPLNAPHALYPWLSQGLVHLLREPKAADEDRDRAPEREEALSADPGEWPEPWRGFWNNVQTSAQMVWTYWELGADIGGTPNRERRSLWMNLIRALNRPKGCVTFWPMSHRGDRDIEPHPRMFWHGVNIIRPRFVAVFGRQAFIRLFPEKSYTLGRLTCNEYNMAVLPGPEELLASEPEFDFALGILKDLVQG